MTMTKSLGYAFITHNNTVEISRALVEKVWKKTKDDYVVRDCDVCVGRLLDKWSNGRAFWLAAFLSACLTVLQIGTI